MCGAERSLVCVGLSKSVFALIALRSNIVYCVRIWGRMRIKEAEYKRGGKCAMYVMGLEGRGRPTVARTSLLFVLRRAMGFSRSELRRLGRRCQQFSMPLVEPMYIRTSFLHKVSVVFGELSSHGYGTTRRWDDAFHADAEAAQAAFVFVVILATGRKGKSPLPTTQCPRRTSRHLSLSRLHLLLRPTPPNTEGACWFAQAQQQQQLQNG